MAYCMMQSLYPEISSRHTTFSHAGKHAVFVICHSLCWRITPRFFCFMDVIGVFAIHFVAARMAVHLECGKGIGHAAGEGREDLQRSRNGRIPARDFFLEEMELREMWRLCLTEQI